MPRFDGTGPDGKGPMTGRGLGKCSGNTRSTTNKDASTNYGQRNGLGRKLRGRFRNI